MIKNYVGLIAVFLINILLKCKEKANSKIKIYYCLERHGYLYSFEDPKLQGFTKSDRSKIIRNESFWLKEPSPDN